MSCLGHAGVMGNDRIDRLAGKATITSGLRLRRSEVLGAQSEGHYSIDRLEQRRGKKKR